MRVVYINQKDQEKKKIIKNLYSTYHLSTAQPCSPSLGPQQQQQQQQLTNHLLTTQNYLQT